MTTPLGRVAIYARYSSDRQSETSIEDQVARCRRFVVERGAEVLEELVFADVAISGASLERPGLQALLRAVAEKRVDVVVTEDLSRVSRRQADAHTLLDRLAFAGVGLLGVADAIDTRTKSSKLLYSVRSMLADAYLDDLSDKTRRGLDGRARAGLATGGLPYGYRSVPREAGGAEIAVDDERAPVLRRIFALYASGRSYAAIAAALNADAIPAPRASSRRRHAGWCATAIREMLRNERYVGTWRFGERRWVKVPGTNRRVPRPADPADVVTLERPDLRIVDAPTWDAVQARLRTVATSGGPRGSGKRLYLLSGLLRCGACGSVLAIHGGAEHRRYYGCTRARTRGTCTNRLNVRESVVRERVIAAIRERFRSAPGLAVMRAAYAQVLGETGRAVAGELAERRRRLERTEERIRTLALMQADGDRSTYIGELRRDLEAQARTDRAAIEALEQHARAPAELPSFEELLEGALDLDRSLESDPAVGRERVRALLDGGAITMTPQADGSYRARFGLLPAGLPETATPSEGGPRDGAALVVVAGAAYVDFLRRSSVPVDLWIPGIRAA